MSVSLTLMRSVSSIFQSLLFLKSDYLVVDELGRILCSGWYCLVDRVVGIVSDNCWWNTLCNQLAIGTGT